MVPEATGWLHARLLRAARATDGQGTVEYVGLILLVGVVLAGIVKASGSFSDAGIARAVVKELKDAIEAVGGR